MIEFPLFSYKEDVIKKVMFYTDVFYNNISTEYDVVHINSQPLFILCDQELLCVNSFLVILLHFPRRMFIETISHHAIAN